MNMLATIKKMIGSVAMILLFGLQTKAQVLTVDSIFNRIENYKPELKVYDNLINAYDTYANGAKSIDPPLFGTGFFMTPYNTQMWKADATTNYNGMGSVMLTAQQMFRNPRKLKLNYDYMKNVSKVERENKNFTKNELFFMAKMQYYEWLILKKKLKVLLESEELLKYLIELTELRYTYGLDKLNSYYKATGMLGDVQLMKIISEQEIGQNMIELNTLMNRNKQIVFDIDTNYTIKDYEAMTIDTGMIPGIRSDYKALDQSINVLHSRQLYEKSNLLPDFGVRYDHMFTFGTQPQLFSFMGMITFPIAPWSSKVYKSNVSGLNFEMNALKNQQSDLVNQVIGNIENLKIQIKSKKQQVKLYEETIIPSMRKNYETSMLAYEQNTEELFIVLDAWENLKVVQQSYLDQLMELIMLQIEFEKQLEIK